MKILFVTTSTELGGAEQALGEMALFLKERHQIKIISLKRLGTVAERLIKKGIDVQTLGMTHINQITVPGKIRKMIQSFRPDIVHALLYRAIEFTRMACFGLPVKLITTPHYDLSKKFFPARWLDKCLCGLDAVSVAESFSTAQYLLNKQHYSKQKVYLLPNGVDKSCFRADKSVRERMRQAHSVQPDEVVFLSVARLEPVKNLILAVQALRNVLRVNPSARLVLVGEGSDRLRLENFIRQNHMEKQVILVGEQNNIAEWLNMADVFVLPSLEESLPLALLEAICVGLPCLVSKVGDMPLWVEHGENGFVFVSQDITLASCFMTELMSAETRLRMQKKAHQKANLIHSVPTKYEEIYQQILTNSFHVKTKNKAIR